MHEAAKWRQQTTIKLLMHSDCRINMRNSDNETPIDIAQKEGYNDITAQLSGLGFTNYNLQDSCGCMELRRILFEDKEKLKSEELKKINPKCSDGENIINHIEEKIRRTSDDRLLLAEQSWREKLEHVRAEVMAQCESRIAQVELQCQRKVAMIERQCTQRIGAARRALGDSFDRSPSAPEQCENFFGSSSNISRASTL